MTDFKRGDKVTIDDGERIYHVDAVGVSGRDLHLTSGPDEHRGTWVEITPSVRKVEDRD